MIQINRYLLLIAMALIDIMALASDRTPQMKADTLPPGPVVDIRTTLGDIKVKLYDDTPLHRDNFLKLAGEGFYDGVLFHRVIKDFMVQTGDPDSRNASAGAGLGSGDPGYTLKAEIDYPRHFHKYGALAAARTPDNVNPEKKSSGSQFYIVTGKKYDAPTLRSLSERMGDKARQTYFRKLTNERRDEIKHLMESKDSVALENLRQELIRTTEANVKAQGIPADLMEIYQTQGGTPFLDGDYTVFGEVLEGMDTVEKIQDAATDPADRPKEDIRIISMTPEK